jgi:hypothetical protein
MAVINPIVSLSVDVMTCSSSQVRHDIVFLQEHSTAVDGRPGHPKAG